jgi:catechol 2,3-dioxygenase-like lactoylglutathione lyase family enzyme
MTTVPDTDSSTAHAEPDTVTLRLEAVVIPVADYDRARAFYTSLGWRVDADADDQAGYRLMQLTPPGSDASVLFGTRVTAAPAGSLDGLLLVVDDIEQARAALIARGVAVSESFHDVNGGLGGGFHPGDEGRAPGPDPERRSYATYASFEDPDGNRWVLQELTTRLPGRLWDTDAAHAGPGHDTEQPSASPARSEVDADRLAELLSETAQHHDAFEKAAPEHQWWHWYAPYLLARQEGLGVTDAERHADSYMATRHGIIAARG